MWTPKRVSLLLLGAVLFVAAFVLYNRLLGGIDGLPPLPESYYPADVVGPHTDHHESPRDEKLQQAFGAGCPELKWPILLEVRSRDMVLAAADFQITEDHRVLLTPLHIALFKKPAAPGEFPEINTIEAEEAYLKFDGPVSNYFDISHRKLTEAELLKNVRVRNNRHTLAQNDDISIRIPTGTVHYEDDPDGKQRIWTNEHVIMIDEQSKPEPTVVTAKGMVVYLAKDESQVRPGRGSAAKAGTEGSSFERIVLKATVRMTLWMDPDSQAGFLDTGRTERPVTEPAKEADGSGEAREKKPEPKSKVRIETDGPFEYDVAKDLARFERGGQQGAFPEQVKVIRINGDPNLGRHDQLYCDRLDLKFHPKAPDPAKPKGSQPKQTGDREIEWVEATGESVQILSDSEMFNAVGTYFRYEAKMRKSILRSDLPEGVQALKDANEIHVRGELQLVSEKDGTRLTALGAGRITARDKHTDQTQAPMIACWDKSLESLRESLKDGGRDLYILRGNASFEDPQSVPPRILRGDTIKVWMEESQVRASGDKANPPGGAAAPEEHGRRLSQIEVTGNVFCQAPEIKIENTDHLLSTFKDPPPGKSLGSGTGRSLPLVGGPQGSGSAQAAGVGSGSPPKQLTDRVGSGSPPAEVLPDASRTPQRPIELTGHDVTATFLRYESRNELDVLTAQGNVHVHQDPADKDDKGVDISGDFLTLTNKGDGHELHVTGDIALVRLNKIQIAGPQVTIDQVLNHADVQGTGSMVMESSTTLQGEPLPRDGDRAPKTVPVVVSWEKSMTFDGREARFTGNVTAEQERSHLWCQRLDVTLDKPVSFKEGEKKGQSPAIRDLNCVQSVTVLDSTVDDKGLLTKYQRFEGPSLVLNNEDGQVNAGGKGLVRILQSNTDDPLLAPGVGSGARPQPKGKEEMKLTRIEYGNSMWADKKKNLVKFRGSVEVFNLPTNNPEMKLDKTKLPPGAFYMRSEYLNVLGKVEKVRNYQYMEAWENVIVQSPEIFGRASRVTYDEEKDQLIFTGEGGTVATVTKLDPGVPPDRRKEITAGKIIYDRKTGVLRLGDIGGVQGGP